MHQSTEVQLRDSWDVTIFISHLLLTINFLLYLCIEFGTIFDPLSISDIGYFISHILIRKSYIAYLNPGLTGFDIKVNGFVSMPGIVDTLVIIICTLTIGENNFALAA